MKKDALSLDLFQGHFDNYIKWLRDNTCFKEVGQGWVEITTPHLDRHNDCLQFYASHTDGGIQFSDGGYIIDDLEASGVQLNSPKRRKILDEILNGFGVKLVNGNELFITANADNFPIKKNNFIQAMLAVNDMFALASSSVASLFFEDVKGWLDNNDIRYVPSIKLNGKSGFDFCFDFVIPKHKEDPERILQVMTNPTKTNVEQLLFSWSDTKSARPDDNSKLFAIINDVDQKVSSTIIQSLENYEVTPIRWSKRQKFVEELAA